MVVGGVTELVIETLMSDEYDTRRNDKNAPPAGDGDRRPGADDPLVELARIVHKNKTPGAGVSSGRVGSTDYFAELDAFAGSSSEPERGRVEPAFTRPVEPRFDDQANKEPVEPQAPVQPDVQPIQSTPSDFQPQDDYQPVAHQGQDSAPTGGQVGSIWPDVPNLDTIETTAQSAMNRPYQTTPAEPEQPAAPRVDPVFQNVATAAAQAAPATSEPRGPDLESSLTAGLEDELIGALRQSVDTPGRSTAADDYEAAPAQTPSAAFEPAQDHAETAIQASAESSVANRASYEGYQTGPAGFDYGSSALNKTITPAEAAGFTSDGYGSAAFEAVPPVNDGAQESGVAGPARPAINEDDLFAALNPAAETDSKTGPEAETDTSAAGIDALFADLDFPDPASREAKPEENSAPKPAQTAGASIDDMAWPAAASSVPNIADEDETPPPPEGYDLDAVARAMQESDPSLTGAGVLPPHSRAEQTAVPNVREKSRRGLFVTAGVLGVALVGAGSFFLIDNDGVAIPDGPPPVILGLQEPLKVFPEQTEETGGNQSAKLIYDRVDGTTENAPERLVPTDTPQPAELPPAPDSTVGGADLAPGAPRQVRTLVVRPDGTIISDGAAATPEPSAPPAVQTPTVPAPAAPAAAADGTRVITTSPVVGTPAQVPGTPAVAQPTTPEPAVQTPSVEEPQAATTDETPTPPPADLVTVSPRKKPDAPVQVAQAPAPVAVQPSAGNDGPLNLAQPAAAAAPAPAAPSATPASGSIAAGTYIVQVTSQRSAAAASDAYSGLQRRFPTILGNRNAVIVSADLGDRGIFYRARIPTGSREEAISLCESLQGAGGDCFVRRQ
ncbi:hypothetical protein E1180_11655 [Roseibium denhamense]|uniref:Sporulation related domain-containing protein n=1 Tax=Roseibium denhamense TaxID=76305 RepID=A0ABY1PEE5_9HYPH|nr:SPOR domain-containing protein [Roseibium denhamense]MTI06169.1 hypothetical protein [Roseibium denhamense]SMP32356.1 Sporulation related domain-containing protein [Roseibium denhamense]